MRAVRRLSVAEAASVSVWLQTGHDGEPGVEGLLGFTTWAETRAELDRKLDAKLGEYLDWRARAGLPATGCAARARIAGELHGNEILLEPDRAPATRAELELVLALLERTRVDLLAAIEGLPEAALDWDPPYRRFSPWADWRTIRANLAHVANGETQYYLRNVGCAPNSAPIDARGDWRAALVRARAEAVAALRELAGSADLGRVASFDTPWGREDWSLRKALRRMVSHERTHAKSLARIARAWREAHGVAR